MRRIDSETPPRMPRWLTATLVLLSVAVLINYIDRGNLATASPLIKQELGLSATELGFLLTAFFITYVPMMIAVGWLADRFGAARVLAVGFVVWSLAMSLTGFAHGFAMMVLLRLVLGVGESVFFPTSSLIIARCFPEAQRGMANSVVMAGMACGPAFGIFFGGLLIAAYGWRPFFIGFGLVSLIWIIPWLAIAQPRLVECRARATDIAPATLTILRQRSLWGASVAHFCSNYVWYFVLSWIPYYLVEERHWSISGMAKIGGSGYLLMAGTCLFTGWYTDRRIASGSSPGRVRKSFLGAGSGLSAVFIGGSAFASDGASVFLFLLACASFGLVSPNVYAVAQSLAGANAAGRWVGIQNCIGNCAGLVAPFLTGVLVDQTGNFTVAFLITSGVCIVAGLAWTVGIGPVAPIDWAHKDRLPVADRVAVAPVV